MCIEFLRIATVAATAISTDFTRLPPPLRQRCLRNFLSIAAAASKPKEEAAGRARSRCNRMQVVRVYSVDLDASGGLGQYHALKYALHGGGFALFS